jgi:hypothetical protein
MNRDKNLVVSVLIMMGIAAAVLSLSTGIPAKASAANTPDALQNIPSDYHFVSGINVRRLTASSFYLKLRQEQPQAAQLGSMLARFTEQTGIDPIRDISYLVLAGRRNGESTKPEGLVIVSGEFDRKQITSFIRSKAAPIETEYGGTAIMMVPDKTDASVKNGMAFLSEHEIAMGSLISLKAALDTRTRVKKNIRSNATISSLLSSINMDEMFWFAADAAGALRESPIPMPPAINASSIQSIAGAFDINEDIVGEITATAIDSNAATKLADIFRGVLALGQLSQNQNPDLRLLLNTITIAQNAAQINLSFNIPGDLLKKLERKGTPLGAT